MRSGEASLRFHRLSSQPQSADWQTDNFSAKRELLNHRLNQVMLTSVIAVKEPLRPHHAARIAVRSLIRTM